jgi:hypothetical protein
MFELIQGYRDFLQSIRVPAPVRSKLQMERWPAPEPKILVEPFAAPAGSLIEGGQSRKYGL